MQSTTPGFLVQLGAIFYLIFPLYVLILVGYILKKSRLVGADQQLDFSRLNFYGAAPAIIFFEISKSDVNTLFTNPVLLILALGVTAASLLLYLMGWVMRLTPAQQGVFVQGSFRSNMFYIGIPVCDLVFGGQSLGFAFIVLALILPLYNFLSVLALSLPHQSSALNRSDVRQIATNILKNPLIISVLLGIAVQLFQVQVPSFLTKSLEMLGKISLPLALVEVGSSLRLGSVSRLLLVSWLGVLMKLVLVPLGYLVFLLLFGAEGSELKTMIVLMAAPTAMMSYIMAKNMKGDETMATHLVVVTTFFSMVTLPLWVWALDKFV